MKKNHITDGPIFKSLIIFSFPIIITNTLSIIFHATDVAVLAFFSNDADVAAVGACGSLITLMVSLFSGLSTGANVLISKRVGAGDEQGTKRAVGTSLSIGILSGFILWASAENIAWFFGDGALTTDLPFKVVQIAYSVVYNGCYMVPEILIGTVVSVLLTLAAKPLFVLENQKTTEKA